MTYIIYFYFAFMLSSLFMPVSIRLGRKLGIVDRPDSRKVHTTPIPRTGGLAVVAASIVPVLLGLQSPLVWGFFAGGLCLFVFGLLDDWRNLNYRVKLLAQIVSALIFIAVSDVHVQTLGELLPGVVVPAGVMAWPVTVVFMVAAMNIVNLADGLDSLAAGLVLITLICCGFLAFQQTDFPELILLVSLAGALIGFLRYNLHPAQVFMGDTGSQFLGYTLAVVLLALTQGNSIYSPVLPLFVLGIPIIDMALVMYERSRDGRSIFQPDKNHLHHKCLHLGLNHEQAVMAIYLLHLALVGLGWTLRFSRDYVVLGSYLAILGGSLAVRILIRHYSDQAKRLVWSLVNRFSWLGRELNIAVNRQLISKFCWRSFFLFFAVYFLISPIYLKQGTPLVGVAGLGLMLVAFGALFLSRNYPDLVMQVILILCTFYVIVQAESSQNGIGCWVLDMELSHLIFLLVTVFYALCLLLTPEKNPFDAMDFIFVSLAVFVFFIPVPVEGADMFKSILIKAVFFSLAIKLIFSRIQRNRRYVLALNVYTLGVAAMMGLLG